MTPTESVFEFSIVIEDIVKEHKLNYMDAIVFYCEKSGLEIEVAAKLISPVIKSKITVEAEDLHLIKRSARLVF